MAGSTKSVEIEDVLSSIRRLVSEHQAQRSTLAQARKDGAEPPVSHALDGAAAPGRADATHAEAGTSDDGALILTPSLRVAEPDPTGTDLCDDKPAGGSRQDGNCSPGPDPEIHTDDHAQDGPAADAGNAQHPTDGDDVDVSAHSAGVPGAASETPETGTDDLTGEGHHWAAAAWGEPDAPHTGGEVLCDPEGDTNAADAIFPGLDDAPETGSDAAYADPGSDSDAQGLPPHAADAGAHRPDDGAAAPSSPAEPDLGQVLHLVNAQSAPQADPPDAPEPRRDDAPASAGVDGFEPEPEDATSERDRDSAESVVASLAAVRTALGRGNLAGVVAAERGQAGSGHTADGEDDGASAAGLDTAPQASAAVEDASSDDPAGSDLSEAGPEPTPETRADARSDAPGLQSRHVHDPTSEEGAAASGDAQQQQSGGPRPDPFRTAGDTAEQEPEAGAEATMADGAAAADPGDNGIDDLGNDFIEFGDDEEDDVMDEDALRDFVAEVVRQELQGALGERITRNIRKLVRREIRTLLAAEHFD